MNRKAVSVIFGSEKDLEHVKGVVGYLKTRGWGEPKHGFCIYGQELYMKSKKPVKACFVYPGSVHRDLDGTVNYVNGLSVAASDMGDRLVFLTCIGLNDDASGVIASSTGRRVFAVPPDSKNYNKYPSGVRVYPFSQKNERLDDIVAAVDALELEFDKKEWLAEDQEAEDKRTKARENLDNLRGKVYRGEIGL